MIFCTKTVCFQVSSTASANPLDVEDYLDSLEEVSSRLLEYVVNMTDISVSGDQQTQYCSFLFWQYNFN